MPQIVGEQAAQTRNAYIANGKRPVKWCKNVTGQFDAYIE
jgi:hypothetical protein